MPAEEPTLPQPVVPPTTTSHSADDEPTLVQPSSAETEVLPPSAAPEPELEKWAGRVILPREQPPGQRGRPAPPPAPTRTMTRVTTRITEAMPPARRGDPRSAQSPPPPPPPPARRGRLRRFVLALVAVGLLLAVPVVSAYVAFKLTSGENPFEWPPSIDYEKVFG